MSDKNYAGSLMKDKRGLVMGVANEKSIAWGIAKMLAEHGAELAFTFQGEGFEKRVRPLAETVGSDIVLPCDVTDDASLDAVFAALKDKWGTIDFLVHSLAFSDKNELTGRFINTTRENFKNSMDISAFSFIDTSRRAAELMPNGGSIITLTFEGSTRVIPNYNVMGVGKAALEAATRYLAVDLGADNIRVNALSAGPMRTLAGAAIGSARALYRWTKTHSPIQENVAMEDVGGAGVYLLSDLSGGVTGEVHFVDNGYHVVGAPDPANLG